MWTCKFCKGKFDSDSPDAIEESKFVHFCSIECQENYNAERAKKITIGKNKTDNDKVYRDKIFDYVKNRTSKPNYGMISRQAKTMTEDFDISYKQLWTAIVYAEKIENMTYDSSYGLRQFDKYIIPSIRYTTEKQKVSKIKIKLKVEEKPTKFGRLIKPLFINEEDINLGDED